ncbi:Cystathionine beta-lyase [Diplonema papillatum]|nr:Cystathionine beta-lyase [Diplonema papillatum]
MEEENKVLRGRVSELEKQMKELESERDMLEFRNCRLTSLLEEVGKTTNNEISVADHLADESWQYAIPDWLDQSGNVCEPHNFEKMGSVSSFDASGLPTHPERPHFHKKQAALHPATQVVIFDGCPNDPYHPSSMPIYQTATFVQPSIEQFGPYDYTRSGNPTRTALEVLIAKLERAHSAFAFSTGMGALTTITQLFSSGDEIIACSDLYGGMHRLLTQVCNRFGIKLKFVDTTDLNVLKTAISPGVTKMIHIESPSNPLMRITDLSGLAEMAHKHDILVSVDSTMMSPYLWQPLTLGADIAMHSGTKFLNGHSDTMVGVVCVKTEDLARRVGFLQNAEGTALAPFDSWLVLRGLKTLAVRIERQQYNAMQIAKYLSTVPQVTRLHYAGLFDEAESSPLSQSKASYDLHCKQARGGGSVLSFETGDTRLSQRVVDACRLVKITVSFGSCNSVIEMPCLLSHASIPAEKRTLPPDLIRLSVGIEDVNDLLYDLQRAFKYASSGAKDVRAQIERDIQKADAAQAAMKTATPAPATK